MSKIPRQLFDHRNKLISMKYLCLSLLMLLLKVSVINGQSTVTGTITMGGQVRDYRLHIPPGHTPAKPAPLVFNLHGYTSNAAQQELYSGMNAVSDTAGFLVCYPNGIGNAWNVGWAFGSTADDVSFISALIDEFYTKYNIEKERVYSCGMSNGGFMSYKLACDLNDRIAAIASVTGSMVPAQLTTCKPGRPVPVMEVHGTADPVVNYNGSALISAAIPDVLKFWQENNGCDEAPEVTAVPNLNTADNTTSEKWTYKNCNTNGSLLHFKVFGGAHTWPGSLISTGVTSKDFSASVEIWKFFRDFRLPVSSGTASPSTVNNSISPNPFASAVEVMTTGAGMLEVRDVSGRSYGQYTIPDGRNSIDMSNLPGGFYIFTIFTDGRAERHKLIKN